MARRFIKTSKVNDLGEITPEVVAIVSTKDNIQSENTPQTYFKRNYLDAIRKIVPKFYFADDQTASGTHIPFTSQLINSHIVANNNQATILPVSALASEPDLSAIDTPEGFAKFFTKQNYPATIDPDDFERVFLKPLGYTFRSFPTSASFQDYVDNTFLPSIVCDETGVFDLATNTTSAFDNTSSGTHKYLINNLGWIYFLNRAGVTYDPSSGVSLALQSLWTGNSIVLEDSINIYQNHLWYNQADWSLTGIIPTSYASSVDISAGTWTSGVQLLDNLHTLNNIVYSPQFMDSPDRKVEEAFSNYFTTGKLITDTEEAGPFTRFIQALSFGIADRFAESNELGVLYDIGKCPSQFLELLGELIGWKFVGADVDKWRVQLRNAVEIYKMKGTKRSIQVLLDTIFGTGTYNVNSHIEELWESYIPDLLYYALATESKTFKNFDSYSRELATKLGIKHYSSVNMNLNLKYAVDTILFNIVREFPKSFLLGDDYFPAPQLVFDYDDSIVWEGDYHITEDKDGNFVYRTGEVETESSVDLKLKANPDFLFHYRGREWYVPPYEKRQYYARASVTENLLQRIEFYLKCYGVDEKFVEETSDYIRGYTTQTVDTTRLLNSFLLFGTSGTYPPNYADVINNATKQSTPDPISLLSLWNGKSSHFLMLFDSSSFDFTSSERTYNTKYGITKILSVLDQVIPAHAIPEVVVQFSEIVDAADALADNDCREVRPNFSDYYEGSSNVTTNFAVCAVDMSPSGNRFKRTDADNINDFLLSSTTFIAANRNTLRRRNYKNLLPETKFFTRNGRNNPGSLEPSNVYFDEGIGYIPLGYNPNTLTFQEVATIQNPYEFGIGTLLGDVHYVWDICSNLTSPSSVFGYSVSDTFASRAKLDLTSSNCAPYGRRGQLDEIISIMNKVHDQEKYLQASSIVSGYYTDEGIINENWETSSALLTPTDLSAWFAQKAAIPGYDVVKSIGNHLINQEADDDTLSYYEGFRFGQPIHKFFAIYMRKFEESPLSDNYAKLLGGPSLFSHTYGPLIWNSDFEIAGSALEASGYLAASSPELEVDISYFGGAGVLSTSGMNGLGAHDLGTSSISGASEAYYSNPEFYNRHLVSGIDLLDTSTPWGGSTHPIFSIFDLSRDSVNKFDLSKYLINNKIIKYHRSTDNNSLPRLRVVIDPSNTSAKERNFLEPNCEYSIKVVAHNSDVSSSIIGGQRLGFTIRTQEENGKVWFFDPEGIYDKCGNRYDHWKQVSVTSLQNDGINIIKNYAQVFQFPLKETETSTFDPLITSQTFTGQNCVDLVAQDVVIPGGNPTTIVKLGNNTKEEIEFLFSTKNDLGSVPSPVFYSPSKVHREGQKYILEFFTMSGDQNKFVVFEDIVIENLTYKNEFAIIETDYGDVKLDKNDLKGVFRFLKDLHTGINSRNAITTSGIMEVSGGSRLNYRSNSEMFSPTRDGSYKRITDITINEG